MCDDALTTVQTIGLLPTFLGTVLWMLILVAWTSSSQNFVTKAFILDNVTA